MSMQSWRELIQHEMVKHDDSLTNTVSCTLSCQDLDVKFAAGFGSVNGKAFTLWTNSRVYFPDEYDGAESVRSVSRYPNGELNGFEI